MDSLTEFTRLLNELLVHNGRSPQWLAQQLEVEVTAVQSWLEGQTLPQNPKTIAQIKELLNTIRQEKGEEENHTLRTPIDNYSEDVCIGEDRDGRIGEDVIGGNQTKTNFYGSVTGPIHTGIGDINISVDSPNKEADRRTRENLLLFVKQAHISGVLSRSLYDDHLMQVPKIGDLALVEHPWEWSGSGVEIPPLSENESILSIFGKTQGSLLIVGKAGSGKTITLLELAKSILLLAENDEAKPVPIYFNLSRWSIEQDMLNWLIKELEELYKIDEAWSRRWIQEGTILLLDGLDELKTEQRTACIQAINSLPCRFIVVCCREEVYRKLPKLRLNGAIRLNPLTESQIMECLSEHESLHEALVQHESLRELANSPLMLNIMVRVYAELPLDDEVLKNQSPSFLRKTLFDAYVSRMFNRFFRSKNQILPQESVITKLSWLAQTMTTQGLSSFLIEEIQPNWLPTRSQHWRYFILSRAITGAILGIWLALFIDWSRFNLQLAFTLLTTVASGTVGGIVAGILEGSLIGKEYKDAPPSRFQKIQQTILIGIAVTFAVQICWLFGGLLTGFLFWDELVQSPGGDLLTSVMGNSLDNVKWITVLLAGSLSGLYDTIVIGASFALLFGLQYPKNNLIDDIQTVETFRVTPLKVILKSAFRWSWRGSLVGAFFTVLLGLIGGLGGTFIGYAANLFDDLSIAQLIIVAIVLVLLIIIIGGLISGLVFGALGALLGGIIGGLSGTRMKAKDKTPNEGVHRSGINAFWTGIIAWGTSWFISGFIFLPLYQLTVLLQTQTSSGQAFIGSFGSTLSLAVAMGVFVGLWYGGVSFIKHYTLRFLLWREEQVPRDIVQFLDYGVDLIFLHRVGGEYRFFHNELQEHFMMSGKSMDEPTEYTDE